MERPASVDCEIDELLEQLSGGLEGGHALTLIDQLLEKLDAKTSHQADQCAEIRAKHLQRQRSDLEPSRLKVDSKVQVFSLSPRSCCSSVLEDSNSDPYADRNFARFLEESSWDEAKVQRLGFESRPLSPRSLCSSCSLPHFPLRLGFDSFSGSPCSSRCSSPRCSFDDTTPPHRMHRDPYAEISASHVQQLQGSDLERSRLGCDCKVQISNGADAIPDGLSGSAVTTPASQASNCLLRDRWPRTFEFGGDEEETDSLYCESIVDDKIVDSASEISEDIRKSSLRSSRTPSEVTEDIAVEEAESQCGGRVPSDDKFRMWRDEFLQMAFERHNARNGRMTDATVGFDSLFNEAHGETKNEMSLRVERLERNFASLQQMYEQSQKDILQTRAQLYGTKELLWRTRSDLSKTQAELAQTQTVLSELQVKPLKRVKRASAKSVRLSEDVGEQVNTGKEVGVQAHDSEKADVQIHPVPVQPELAHDDVSMNVPEAEILRDDSEIDIVLKISHAGSIVRVRSSSILFQDALAALADAVGIAPPQCKVSLSGTSDGNPCDFSEESWRVALAEAVKLHGREGNVPVVVRLRVEEIVRGAVAIEQDSDVEEGQQRLLEDTQILGDLEGALQQSHAEEAAKAQLLFEMQSAPSWTSRLTHGLWGAASLFRSRLSAI